MNTPKEIRRRQLVFDIETVPCIKTGERVLLEAEEALEMGKLKEKSYSEYVENLKIWMKRLTDKDADDSTMVKLMFSKVVAISCLIREGNDRNQAANIKVISFPLNQQDYSVLDDTEKCEELFDESTMIQEFFKGVGANGDVNLMPQLVGFYSKGFDLPVLAQRALINGIQLPYFFQRPNKPWEGVDYIAGFSEDHIDLTESLSSHNRLSKYSLDQICRAQGIPGKIAGIDGSQVDELYTNKEYKKIVQYCETDVFSTYLLFLNTLKLTNKISIEAYNKEMENFWGMIGNGAETGLEHYEAFENEAKRLQNY